VVEKHFTLARADGGVDSAFSLEPAEMEQLVIETKRAWQPLGKISYDITEAEKKSRQFRRSLYVSEDIRKGEKLTTRNLRIIRPGKGLAPRYYDLFLGQQVLRDVKRGTPINWALIGQDE
jgi:N-acetylneuraminate synthase